MLKSDAGITEDYFSNDKFIRLLEDIGPVMRGLGVAVQALSNKMSVAAVDDARQAAQAYLAGKLTSLKPRDADALIGLVVSGYPVASNGRVCKDSEFTLDDLQNTGTIYLVPSPDSFYEYRVDMSRLAFNALLAGGYGRTRRGAAAAMLLGCLDSRDWSSFKKFVALQHFLKKEVFNERSEVGFVKLSIFFAGAAVGDKLQSQLLRLDTNTGKLSTATDAVLFLTEKHFPDSGDRSDALSLVEKGGVVLNSPGTKGDVISRDSLRGFDDSGWKQTFTVLASGGGELSEADIMEDNVRAWDSKGKSKALKSDQIMVIHFSNRKRRDEMLSDQELSQKLIDKKLSDENMKELSGENLKKQYCPARFEQIRKRSIVVDYSCILQVAGPMFGRLLQWRSNSTLEDRLRD